MKRAIIQWFMLALAVAACAAIAWVTTTGVTQVTAIDQSVLRQEATIDSLRTERLRLKDEIARDREHAKALADSLPSAVMGYATRRALSIAKQERNLEGRVTRSRQRIKNLENKRREVESRMVRWNTGLGIGAVLSLATYLILRVRKR